MLGGRFVDPNRRWLEMHDNVKRWHRWGGPAMENSSGAKEWYFHGVLMYSEDGESNCRKHYTKHTGWSHSWMDQGKRMFSFPGYSEAEK